MDNDTLNRNYEIAAEWLKHSRSLYFFLPDGPYGRPFDSVFTFSTVTLGAHGAEFRLSDEVTFKLTGDLLVREEGQKLILSGFETLEFVDGLSDAITYRSGELCFVRL